MILTNKTAKDLESVIKKGLDFYDADVMLSDIEGYRKRKRITNEEAEYLKGLVEAQLDDRLKINLSKI